MAYKRNNMNNKHLYLVDIERNERAIYAIEHSVIHFICVWNVKWHVEWVFRQKYTEWMKFDWFGFE